jgi:hypothetical protein
LFVPICGPDPSPDGDPLQNISPQLLVLLSQLAGMGAGVPAEGETTPLDCNFDMNLSDEKGAPIDDCEVTLATAKPCTMAIDASVDEPGGSLPNTPTARLAPVAVTFLPPAFDIAGDLAITNGSVNGEGSFNIRVDGGGFNIGVPCVVDIYFPMATSFEGGILPSVPDSMPPRPLRTLRLAERPQW